MFAAQPVSCSAYTPHMAGVVPGRDKVDQLRKAYADIFEELPQVVKDFLSGYLWQIGANWIEHGTLMRIAQEESGYRRDVGNSESSAYGVFQYLSSTWQTQCSGDVGDYQAQARCALKDLRLGMISQWEVTKKW